MPDSNSENITPSDISLSTQKPAAETASSENPAKASPRPLGMGEPQQVFQAEQKHQKILWGIFALLLLLVIGVIFILPNLVSPSDSEPTVVVINTASSSTRTSEISPFQEAQVLKQRENAQNVLATLLELQDTLVEKEIERWGQTEMLSVIEHAENGDKAYSEQTFKEAELFYLQGLEVLQNIEANLPATFTLYINKGDAAILDSQPEQAQDAFSIALAIDPLSQAATIGYDRALVLAEVIDLLNRGTKQHENILLEEARTLYQQALTIDDEHLASLAALNLVNVDIIDRDFANFMSQGYGAIQAEKPSAAETFFRQALALKPNSSQALSALEQAGDQITFSALTLHLDAAQAHVTAERWQEALNEYEQALLVAPNVVTAVEGRNRSNSRNNLDIFLQDTLATPLRLAEASVYTQVQRVYNDANNLPVHGPRLTAQLENLSSLLSKITQPVNVQFVSDGITTVTLARISAMGQFTSQSLTLTPGTYTALGVRDGFRDVRQEFIVSIDGQVPVITIQCDEAI